MNSIPAWVIQLFVFIVVVFVVVWAAGQLWASLLMTYVFIRSWHVVRSWEPPKTRCGRTFDPNGEATDDLPGDKSCETCLRWVARELEKQVTG